MSPNGSTPSEVPLVLGSTPGAIVANFHSATHIEPPMSHVWVWFLLGMLGLLFIRALRHRSALLRRGVEADKAYDEHAVLAPGMRFVHGRVELAEGCDSAVSVHVEQHGTEREKGNKWSHEWKEIERKTQVAPFYVRTNKKERVRVEPGADVLLVDDPDQMIWTEKTKRTRLAALSPNEEVVVEGKLDRGHDPEFREAALYRGSAQGWVMRPISGERMHISAEKLGERYRKHAKVFGSAAVTLALVTSLVSLLCGSYLGSLFLGNDTSASVVDRRSYSRGGTKRTIKHYYEVILKAHAPGEPHILRKLEYTDWAGITRGMTVAYRDVPAWRALSEPGWGSSIHMGLLILSSIVAFAGFAVYRGAASHKEWYDEPLEDHGSGRLPDPPQQEQ